MRREKGEGRSTSRPRETLKFQKFFKVVALLSLDLDDASQHMHNVLALCTSIIANVFMIQIDGQDRRASKPTQQSTRIVCCGIASERLTMIKSFEGS